MMKGLFTHTDTTTQEAAYIGKDPAHAIENPLSQFLAQQQTDTVGQTSSSVQPDHMGTLDTWPQSANLGALDLPSYDLGMQSWADPSAWSTMNAVSQAELMHPLDASLIFHDWDGFSQNAAFPQETEKQCQDQYSAAMATPHNATYMDNVLPPTPPTANQQQAQTAPQSPLYCSIDRLTEMAIAHELTPPSSTRSNSTSSQDEYNYNTLSPRRSSYSTFVASSKARRRSEQQHQDRAPTPRRRATSHPSVASVVSLTAHEPVAKFVDGVEYITFLYSHDRMVKEYTVCTDINSISVDDIPIDFRLQNSIYPRANVDREEYDGNRWGYETSCNALGWQICWLNRDQLFGRRGLIQRAVDSYRNRHPEMRSRRVARQEKIANGTLRKRRAKRGSAAVF